MSIHSIRSDIRLIEQSAHMALQRNFTEEERSFIESIIQQCKEGTPRFTVSISSHAKEDFHLDPQLVLELVTEVKQRARLPEEKTLLFLAGSMEIQDMALIEHPFLRNYLLILACRREGFKLSTVIEDEKERIALAYSALHGTLLTKETIAAHLEAFEITDPEHLHYLEKKLQI